jgi:EAL domain-containing protein (putative c-di-GMP-specific phosphodiesterase class I)/CheY-like chemotaxis protein
MARLLPVDGDAPALNVLVVEDDWFQRRTTCRLLRQLGCAALHEAGDGQQALQWLQQRPAGPLLILCDLEMPEVDGITLLRELRDAAPDAVVAICSAQDPAVLRTMRGFGTDLGINLVGVLAKPIERVELAQVIQRAVEGGPRRTVTSAPSETSPLDIDEAIDAGWVQPFFEPKIRVRDGAVVGCELLARIVHPQLGVIPPARFIAQVIDSVHELRFTEALLRQTVPLARDLAVSASEFSISLNVTPSLAVNDHFSGMLHEIIGSAGLPAERWVLELTETSATSDSTQLAENLARLTMEGYRFSIDDFGTGFSSLQRLLRLPFSELKLDRSFIQDIDSDRTTQIVIETVIQLSQRLGLNTVAEGVETGQQLEVLRRLGCEVAQGYLYSRAMPGDRFIAWLREQQRILNQAQATGF